MKNLRHPVLATVIYGLAAGLSLISLSTVFGVMPFRPDAMPLTLWLSAAGYGVLLCRWSGHKLKSVIFPLFFLGLTIYLVPSRSSVFLLALAGMSWIRSGICFRQTRAISIWIELLLCLVGAGMVGVFSPATPLSWALAIWLLFLLQAAYFALMDDSSAAPGDKFEQSTDPFERSSRRAMAILAQDGIE